MKKTMKRIMAKEGLIILGLLAIAGLMIFASSRLPMPRSVTPGLNVTAEEGFVKDLETGNTYRMADFELRERRGRYIRAIGILLLLCPVYLIIRATILPVVVSRKK